MNNFVKAKLIEIRNQAPKVWIRPPSLSAEEQLQIERYALDIVATEAKSLGPNAEDYPLFKVREDLKKSIEVILQKDFEHPSRRKLASSFFKSTLKNFEAYVRVSPILNMFESMDMTSLPNSLD